MSKPSETQLKAATRAIREAIDASGYGMWVSDDKCAEIGAKVAQAVVAAK